MRARAALAAVAAAAVAAGCTPARYRVRAPPVESRGAFVALPSGLRVVAYELPGVDRFTLAMSYRAGAADDPPGEEGLAHLVEHLAFRARPGGPGAPRAGATLAASGWRFNAYTAHDDTTFWSSGRPGDLGAALDLEAARLREPLAGVEPDDLEIERDVVLAEQRERFESDEGEFAALMEAAFAGHRFGRPASGDAASLQRVTLEHLRAWVRDRYVAKEAVLAIVSPLPAAEVIARVRAAFGEPDGESNSLATRDEPPPLPGPRPEKAVTLPAPVERPRVWVGWPVPGRFDRGALHPDLAAGVLEAALWDELRRHWLVENTVAVETGFTEVGAAGLLWARVEVDDERLAGRAADAARAAARELGGRFRIPKELVDRYEDHVQVAALLALEDLDAAAMARFLRATGDPDFLAAAPRVAAEQLRRPETSYARRWLRPERAAVVVALPDRNVAARSVGAAPPSARARPEPLEDEGSGAAVPGAEAAAEVARPPPLALERRTLANGLEAVVAKRGTLPIAEVRLLLRTGPQGTSEIPSGLPALALSHASTWLARARASSVGARESVSIGVEHVALRQRGSSANLEVLLESTARWARDQRFGAPELEASQRQLSRRLHWYRAGAPQRAWWLVEERLFPGHAYGAHATPEGVARLGPGEAQRWLRENVRPERATLLVVSDRAPSPELWAAIEREFGGWRGDGDAPLGRAARVPAAAARSIALLDRPGASRALVLVGVRAPPAAARDEAGWAAARWLLASRLQQRLRVETGAAYAVHALQIEHDHGAALVLAAHVPATDAGEVARTILDGVATLAAAPADAAAVARARWRVARALGQRFDTVAGTAAALQEAAVRGRAGWEELPASVAALDPARVAAAAAALGVGREAVVVLGDAGAVRAPLVAAGLEPELVPDRSARR